MGSVSKRGTLRLKNRSAFTPILSVHELIAQPCPGPELVPELPESATKGSSPDLTPQFVAYERHEVLGGPGTAIASLQCEPPSKRGRGRPRKDQSQVAAKPLEVTLITPEAPKKEVQAAIPAAEVILVLPPVSKSLLRKPKRKSKNDSSTWSWDDVGY